VGPAGRAWSLPYAQENAVMHGATGQYQRLSTYTANRISSLPLEI